MFFTRPAVLVAAILGIVIATLANEARPALAAERYIDEVFPSVTVTSNILYGQAINEFGVLEDLRLDLYQPAGDTLPARPVFLFAHGGGFTGGSKSQPDPVNLATRMAKRGFVAASIYYRLREAGFPPEDQVEVITDAKHDVQAAIRWFRANAGTYAIDTGRISLAGYSAGGAAVLFAAYTPGDPGDSGNPGYPSDVQAVVSISGGMGAAADPLMDAGEPPMLVIYGTNDVDGSANAAGLIAAAQASSVLYEERPIAGANHGAKFSPVYIPDIAQWSGEFLFEHVIGGSAVGGLTSLAILDRAPPSERPSWAWWLIPAALLIGPVVVWFERYMRRRRQASGGDEQGPREGPDPSLRSG